MPSLSLLTSSLLNDSRRMDIDNGGEASSVNTLVVEPRQTLELDITTPEICTICLDRITEKATAVPCQHSHFDFACLGTWLQQNQTCPLCKTQVSFVTYEPAGSGPSEIFHLPSQSLPSLPQKEIWRRQQRHHNGRVDQISSIDRKYEEAVAFRRRVYQHKLYSLRVGTNRASGYRNITPELFNRDESLQSRARQWVRRELMVFEFLDSQTSSFASTDRKATNREFFLEYVIAILKAIDIRSNSGQAEALLQDYLGKANAHLFLHELESWLRSPYRTVGLWDRHVQYPIESTT